MVQNSEDFLAVLNTRSQDIFRKIVERYLDTGMPVGSRDLSRMLEVGLSPASVRNVMSDLEDLGLIAAPHTSAGRAPTQQGLRFFVDAMLEVGAVDEREKKQISKHIEGQAAAGPVEDLLAEASHVLSGLSQGAGVVIAAKSDMVLKHIEFVRLDAERAMVILVGEDGQVENRIVPLPAGLAASALNQASNYLAQHVIGRTLADSTHRVYVFESSLRPNIVWVDLQAIDFDAKQPVRKLDLVNGGDLVGDVTALFKPSAPLIFKPAEP